MSLIYSKLGDLTIQLMKDSAECDSETTEGRQMISDLLRSFMVQARKIQFVRDAAMGVDVFLDTPPASKFMGGTLVAPHPTEPSAPPRVWSVLFAPLVGMGERAIVDSRDRIPLGSTLWGPCYATGRVIMEVDPVWGPSLKKGVYLCSFEVMKFE